MNSLFAEPVAVTISRDGQLYGVLDLGPCEAATMTVTMDPPFTVGVGPPPPDPAAAEPMPAVAESDAFTSVDGQYRVLVRVGPDGDTFADDNPGVSPMRAPGEC